MLKPLYIYYFITLFNQENNLKKTLYYSTLLYITICRLGSCGTTFKIKPFRNERLFLSVQNVENYIAQLDTDSFIAYVLMHRKSEGHNDPCHRLCHHRMSQEYRR